MSVHVLGMELGPFLFLCDDSRGVVGMGRGWGGGGGWDGRLASRRWLFWAARYKPGHHAVREKIVALALVCDTLEGYRSLLRPVACEMCRKGVGGIRTCFDEPRHSAPLYLGTRSHTIDILPRQTTPHDPALQYITSRPAYKGFTPLCIAAMPKLKSSQPSLPIPCPAPSRPCPGTTNPASRIILAQSSCFGNRSMLSTRYW